jgi:hypothetical protein
VGVINTVSSKGIETDSEEEEEGGEGQGSGQPADEEDEGHERPKPKPKGKAKPKDKTKAKAAGAAKASAKGRGRGKGAEEEDDAKPAVEGPALGFVLGPRRRAGAADAHGPEEDMETYMDLPDDLGPHNIWKLLKEEKGWKWEPKGDYGCVYLPPHGQHMNGVLEEGVDYFKKEADMLEYVLGRREAAARGKEEATRGGRRRAAPKAEAPQPAKRGRKAVVVKEEEPVEQPRRRGGEKPQVELWAGKSARKETYDFIVSNGANWTWEELKVKYDWKSRNTKKSLSRTGEAYFPHGADLSKPPGEGGWFQSVEEVQEHILQLVREGKPIPFDPEKVTPPCSPNGDGEEEATWVEGADKGKGNAKAKKGRPKKEQPPPPPTPDLLPGHELDLSAHPNWVWECLKRWHGWRAVGCNMAVSDHLQAYVPPSFEGARLRDSEGRGSRWFASTQEVLIYVRNLVLAGKPIPSEPPKRQVGRAQVKEEVRGEAMEEEGADGVDEGEEKEEERKPAPKAKRGKGRGKKRGSASSSKGNRVRPHAWPSSCPSPQA